MGVSIWMKCFCGLFTVQQKLDREGRGRLLSFLETDSEETMLEVTLFHIFVNEL